MDRRTKLALGKMLESEQCSKAQVWRNIGAPFYSETEEGLHAIANAFRGDDDEVRRVVDGVLEHWSPHAKRET